jgi:lysophospholipase L1-like esterase
MTQPHSLLPVPKLENDFYDWWERHQAKVELIKDKKDFQVVFLGDSITHLFEVEFHHYARGGKLWQQQLSKYQPLNLGFGWDRTQNVLWRLENGEVKDLSPKVFVILIGTNNFSETPQCQASTPDEVVLGIRAICEKLSHQFPESHLLLHGILPRGKAEDPIREKIKTVNEQLVHFQNEFPSLTFVDFGPTFLSPDGSIPTDLMNDLVHPTEKGYALWLNALLPKLELYLKP